VISSRIAASIFPSHGTGFLSPRKYFANGQSWSMVKKSSKFMGYSVGLGVRIDGPKERKKDLSKIGRKRNSNDWSDERLERLKRGIP
jgi:hypothetical protein